MNNNENKKSGEALNDDALDKVTGGGYKEDLVRFLEENCRCCCHFSKGCPYDGPYYYAKEYGFTPCPDKA